LETVLSTFRLLYQQAIEVSAKAPEARESDSGPRNTGKISLGGPGFMTFVGNQRVESSSNNLVLK